MTPRPVANIRCFSDDEKIDKKEKLKNEKPKEVKLKNKEAIDRLNSLLASMPSGASKPEIKVITASKKKPTPKPAKLEEKKEKDPK